MDLIWELMHLTGWVWENRDKERIESRSQEKSERMENEYVILQKFMIISKLWQHRCLSHVKIKDRKIENVKVTTAIDRLIIPLIP